MAQQTQPDNGRIEQKPTIDVANDDVIKALARTVDNTTPNGYFRVIGTHPRRMLEYVEDATGAARDSEFLICALDLVDDGELVDELTIEPTGVTYSLRVM
jgi:hypothetical protein